MNKYKSANWIVEMFLIFLGTISMSLIVNAVIGINITAVWMVCWVTYGVYDLIMKPKVLMRITLKDSLPIFLVGMIIPALVVISFKDVIYIVKEKAGYDENLETRFRTWVFPGVTMLLSAVFIANTQNMPYNAVKLTALGAIWFGCALWLVSDGPTRSAVRVASNMPVAIGIMEGIFIPLLVLARAIHKVKVGRKAVR